MRQAFLVLALALGGEAHLMKATKRNRSLKDDKARLSRHLNNLIKGAPAEHKAIIRSEINQLDSDSSDIESWYGYPMTLDWIVDIYFSSDDSTAYKVILDSGSSNLAIALESCTNCGKASTTLDLATYSDMCIEVTYGSGEWFGYEVEPTYVGISSSISTTTTLAGITYQDDFFSGGSSYSGILGMAYKGISESYSSSACSSSRRSESLALSTSISSGDSVTATPYMYALRDSGAIDSNTFAVAMCGDYADVSIGSVDSSMYTGDISYATTQKTFGEYLGYYLIYTTGVSINDVAMPVTNINLYGGLVVDTGTTLHYLPSATTKAIEAMVSSTVGSSVASKAFFEWEACVTSDELKDFPTITYTFAESSDSDATTFDVELTSEHYLLEYGGCYYWGFETSSLGIFGNVGMRDKVMVFDIENTRIGIATGTCSASTETYKTAKQLLGEVVAEVSERSTRELAVGLFSAVAVVGTVLGAAFVVINKLVKKTSIQESEEIETLLPPL